jgi:8-oxo-dGTP pyrophosphatase MutT (NUDIX family)
MIPLNVLLMPWTKEFEVDHVKGTVTVKDRSNGKDISGACTQAFKELIDIAIEKGVFKTLHFKHSEPFPILGAKYPVNVERFAGDLFGITARGAHMTVYTITDEGMKIWVPRRSASMVTYPNKLDTTVAGGVAAFETPLQNIIREAQEEASLPEDLVTPDIKAAGVLTYMSSFAGVAGGKEAYVCPDIVYVYDLEVGWNVKLSPEDGEVNEFYLLSVEQIQESLRRGRFKTNSAVVMLDFFIRHGIITADNEDDYVEIVQRMHRQLPFPTAPGPTPSFTE